MKGIVHRTACASTIIYQGKILIVRRANTENFLPGVWELPGGKKKAFESTKKGLLREIREETGLTKIKIIKLLSLFEYSVHKNENYHDTVQINFLCELEEEQPVVLSSEHQDFLWVGEETYFRYKMTDQVKAVIKEAFGQNKNPAAS